MTCNHPRTFNQRPLSPAQAKIQGNATHAAKTGSPHPRGRTASGRSSQTPNLSNGIH